MLSRRGRRVRAVPCAPCGLVIDNVSSRRAAGAACRRSRLVLSRGRECCPRGVFAPCPLEFGGVRRAPCRGPARLSPRPPCCSPALSSLCTITEPKWLGDSPRGCCFSGRTNLLFLPPVFSGKKTVGALRWAAVQSGVQRGAFRSAGRHQPVVSSRMDPGAGPCPVSLQSPRRAGGCGIPFIGARHAQWVGRGELPQSPPAPARGLAVAGRARKNVCPPLAGPKTSRAGPGWASGALGQLTCAPLRARTSGAAFSASHWLSAVSSLVRWLGGWLSSKH